ncbi:YetF domain-containing protein [Citrobacter sp. JGM124]|uniref:DUF421 domain-containing protein n=1 Tax=Citrobacter sp. JGM124 TaxID=2799789 RepID=UPI001BABF4B3|nr:YetF domain-containing protein [Citrobacter sp. JGM124]MBS0846896.1 DUF421 domain-containing protein [Citrobacter sp. JGM124]
MGYYGFVLLKFIIGFIIVIAHLNFSGKTQLSQMTPVDFIGNFVLGGIIGGVIYNDVIPMYQYILVLLIGVLLISTLNWVSKHVGFFRTVTIGEPIPIIKNGRFLIESILSKKNKIDIMSVSSQLHTQGIHSFQQVRYAQIEPNGQLSVVCEGTKIPAVIVMQNGKARPYELDSVEKDEAWLDAQLARLDIKPEDVFIAEFWGGKLNIILMNGETRR